MLAANHPFVQMFVTSHVPLISHLESTVLSGSRLTLAIGLSIAVVCYSLMPLYKPRPRRMLDTLSLTQKRVLVAMFALATVGYFDYTYRLPQTTVLVTTCTLLVVLPMWFVTIQSRPSDDDARTIIVGDDTNLIERAARSVNSPVVGYLSPPIIARTRSQPGKIVLMDGGVSRTPPGDLRYLGGVLRLEQVLIDYDIDTVVLAFSDTDRAEFFSVLEICYEHGVTAKVLRDHVRSVLLLGEVSDLTTVDLEPWGWQDRLFKRLFDVAFAGIGLLLLSPLLLIIAVAISADSPGPVLYSQDRTSWLGGTFQVYKFRSMIDDAEATTGAVVSTEDAGGIDPRVTNVGLVLRKTHFDEIPQLWSILIGDMSVVGPRPERPILDRDIQASGVDWERRWFVKPGLTGLAQVYEITGFEPEEKLRLDLEYIYRQSFWFDMKIVLRQLWAVARDVVEILKRR